MEITLDNPTLLFIGILLGIYSFVCGLISIYLYKRGNRMTTNTSGRVVGFKKRLFHSESIISSHPVVEYSDEYGNKKYYEAWRGSLIPINNINDKVKVQYNPDNPSEAVINSGIWAINRFITQLLLFIFTIISFFISIILLTGYLLFHFGIVHMYLNLSK